MPVNYVKWVENTSQFDKDFIENYNEHNGVGYFLEIDIQYPEKFFDLYNDLLFFPVRVKLEKVKKFAANLHDKKELFYRTKTFKTNIK